jgi:hypothetical protein
MHWVFVTVILTVCAIAIAALFFVLLARKRVPRSPEAWKANGLDRSAPSEVAPKARHRGSARQDYLNSP